MEEKPTNINQTEIEKSTSRRSRKDEEGRDFQCGCGKRYLSYPALYTHIKTKHDGKQPQGTQKTGTSQITKRVKAKLQEETIRMVLSQFIQFQSNAIALLGEGLRGSVPIGSRIKKEGVPPEVYGQYLLLIKRQEQFKLSDQSSLELAFIVFLINIGELVNDKVYDQFLLFVRLARACFYEHGDEIHKAIYSKKDQGPFVVKDFDLHFVKYFPLVSDFFIRFYIPETEGKDVKEANLSLMEVITFDFCNWLLKRKLTNIRVTMSRNVEIDFKPSVSVKQRSTPGKVQSPKQLYEKEIKEEHDESDQLSEGEDMEDELEGEDKHSGSKEHEHEQL